MRNVNDFHFFSRFSSLFSLISFLLSCRRKKNNCKEHIKYLLFLAGLQKLGWCNLNCFIFTRLSSFHLISCCFDNSFWAFAFYSVLLALQCSVVFFSGSKWFYCLMGLSSEMIFGNFALFYLITTGQKLCSAGREDDFFILLKHSTSCWKSNLKWKNKLRTQK